MTNETGRETTKKLTSRGKAPQKLTAGNAVAHEIGPETKIKVATSPLGGGQALKALIPDVDANPYLALKVSAWAERFSIPELTALLERLNSNLNPRIFATCCAFLPITSSAGYTANAAQRDHLFAKGTPKLSDILNAKAAGSSELAIVAKAALQLLGIKCSYVLGVRSATSGHERHAYIVIQDHDAVYVWDAANPMQLGANSMPRLYTMPADFLVKLESTRKAYLANGKNIFKPTEQCAFGVV